MTNSNNWYCTLPWTGFSNDPDGKVRPCCLYKDYIRDEFGEYMHVQTHTISEILHSDYMKDLRNQFREGKKPLGCAVCITDEIHGHRSKRQIYDRNKQGTDSPLIDFSEEPNSPSEFQMIISNACNLKCRSCSPSHSNLWQAEFKKIHGHTGYKMKFNQSGDKNGMLWKNRHEWMQSVENLEIVGGEPFYIQQWNDIWDEFVESGRSKEINISLSSNATIFSGERVKFLNDNFKSVGLGLSIDGLDKTYEYLRYPGKWDEVQENLIRYNAMKANGELDNTNISISHTIGWINAWHLPQFVEWVNCNTPTFAIWYNLIHSPDHMALWAVPSSVKKIIEDKWDNSALDKDVIKGLINHMNSRSPTNDELVNIYNKFYLVDLAREQKTRKFVALEILDHIKELLPRYELNDND